MNNRKPDPLSHFKGDKPSIRFAVHVVTTLPRIFLALGTAAIAWWKLG